jgi:phage terminase Nu1 subunit (DNA packaging protein)
MNDKSLLDHIHDLVEEEKTLRAAHHGLSSQDRQRLELVERELDQYWDLLRQRRAREEYGENPDEAKERPVNEVESYLQ